MLTFEWDPRKAASNLRKHGVSFLEEKTVFGDRLEGMIPDPEHSDKEERFISIGKSKMGRLLVISYTEENDRIRLISARLATRTERRQYEEDR